jgi:hypothetical protein
VGAAPEVDVPNPVTKLDQALDSLIGDIPAVAEMDIV